jgi:hypothetical protein
MHVAIVWCVGSQPPTPASMPTCRTYGVTKTASTERRLRPTARPSEASAALLSPGRGA